MPRFSGKTDVCCLSSQPQAACGLILTEVCVTEILNGSLLLLITLNFDHWQIVCTHKHTYTCTDTFSLLASPVFIAHLTLSSLGYSLLTQEGSQQGPDNQLPPLPVVYSFNKNLLSVCDVPDTVL